MAVTKVTATPKPRKQKEYTPAPVVENKLSGAIYALGAIVIGIVLWLILWRMGFIASIVAYAIAWLAIRLYGWGAGTVTRSSAPIIVIISIVGVVLAFLSGMISDLSQYVAGETKMTELELLANSSFWLFAKDNLLDPSMWGQYTKDILLSALFAGLGMFFTLKDLFFMPAATSKSQPQPAKR